MNAKTLLNELTSRLGASLLLLSLLANACGGDGNIFTEASGKPDSSSRSNKDQAIAAITAGDWSKAEAQLESLLKENPNDTQARSMLASVLMKKAGIDTLQVADNVDTASDKNGTVHVPTMITLLPAASPENVANLSKSIATLELIPAEERTAPQKLQLAMAQFSYAMILTKKVATNDSGTYDSGKANDMTETEASAIIDMMDTSAVSVAEIGGESNAKGSAKIIKTTDQIKEQDGATNADKLRAYLDTESAKSIVTP